MSEPTRKTSLTPEQIEAAHQAARQGPPLDQATRARLEGLYMRLDAEARQAALDEATAKHLAAQEAHRDTRDTGRDTRPDTHRMAS